MADSVDNPLCDPEEHGGEEMNVGGSYARSIELPGEEMFKNLRNAKRFAIDIGGSLSKVAYISEVSRIRTRHYSRSGSLLGSHPADTSSEAQSEQEPLYTVEEENYTGTRLHFIKFETRYIENCLDFIQRNLLQYGSQLKDKIVHATGGGAFKYKNLLANKLWMEVEKFDEMQCLIKGCNFLLKNIPNECFEFRRDTCAKPKYIFQNLDSRNIFPYLLVNIGSGVSILKVDSETQYERVGGTSTGGGTFWGLGSLLTKAKGFDELLDLASKGQSRNVDMLVKDIYGGDYLAHGLPGDLPASSFGKATGSSMDPNETEIGKRFQPEDIAKSLLFLISNDIGQISSLYANLYGLTRIFFGGYFIRGHPVTMHTITFAVNYFSKGKQQALFLRHEGYLGAIGAFLKGAEQNAHSLNGRDVTWTENYATSSGLLSPGDKYIRFPNKYDVLELDKFTHSLEPCPLLADPSGYKPDLENLGADEEAREYWLGCFEKGIDIFVEQAVQSQSGQSDVKERGEKFREQFLHRLEGLHKNPFSFGELTVRNLLDTREHFMSEFWFSDPYLQVKQIDNEDAMKELPSRLSELDKLPWKQRQIKLVEGLVAGNVFDWGAQAVVQEMKTSDFNFATAEKKIQRRPWLQDDLDSWVKRLEGKPHNLAVVFADNSGGDIILGLFPFARELLQRGTKVILAANSYPAINDVIHSELVILGDRIAEFCPIIRTALAEQQLLIMETGLGSPCLDLRRIHITLVKAMQNADLILLEGIGRSIHTNYNAKFNCESIKLAVLKNPWIAKKFGGQMFDVLFRYENIHNKTD